MYDFILQIAVFASLGVIIYLLARGMARVPETETEAVPPKHGIFDEFLKRLPLRQIDNFISLVLERVLRKIRLVLAKVDNLLNRSISKVKQGDKNGNNDQLPPINQA